MIIYKLLNKINGKVYVGQTTQDINHRIMEHLSAAKKRRTIIGKALTKYGIESFCVSIIDAASTRETLDEKEKYWISFYGCIKPAGYNQTAGGNGSSGYKVSEETRKKMSEASKGRPSPMKGKHHSEETKAKLRLIRGERHRGFGKPISEAQKKKLSIAHMGKRLSEEHKRKLSEAKKGKSGPWLGRRRSEETKQKLREHAIRQKMHRNTITGRFEPTVKSNVQR